MWTEARRLFEDLEQRVGGLLHHVGGGEDEDAAGRFGGEVVGALDEGADLAELDEELRRVGREDEDVGVGLDEDASLLFVGLAEVFAGDDSGGNLLFEIGGGGDADAVFTVTAEAGEGLAVGPEIAGLALALDGHGEQEGEGVFACSGGAGEDDGVGEAAGGDGGAQALDCGGIAEELVEVGGEGGWGHGNLERLIAMILGSELGAVGAKANHRGHGERREDTDEGVAVGLGSGRAIISVRLILINGSGYDYW